MKKLDMQTTDLTQSNIEKIKALFPNAVTESSDGKGGIKYAINFDILKQELSGDVIEDEEECYDFTWVGKNQAILEANTPINKTLRPCIEESMDWENTENLYIEGDNLEVLKLLQESYLNKIKMIYIDPPYNTGNDAFVYRDKRYINKDEYEEMTEQVDDNNFRMFKNTESNGRFHSDWCSELYPLLKLSRNLLTEDGVIFISIDDNEVINLRKICSEIFGETNFIAAITREAIKGGSVSKNIRVTHDYIIAFAKSLSSVAFSGIEVDGINLNLKDEKGSYAKGRELNKWGAGSRREDSPSMFYPIPGPNGEKVYPIRNDGSEGRWRLGKAKLFKLIEEGDVIYEKRENGTYIVYEKLRDDSARYKQFTSLFKDNYINAKGTSEMKSLFETERTLFDYTKPTDLISDLIIMSGAEGSDIILDFYSGSATTAHATMKLNAEDGEDRKYIMVQLDESTDEKSEAYKAEYKNICEIGKERIRRAGEKIKEQIEEENNRQKTINHKVVSGSQVQLFEEENSEAPKEPKKVPDIGFRVLKVADTNMKDVYYSAGEYSQTMLDEFESNIKEDRTDMDLLYQVLLDWGLPLSLTHKIEEFEGYTLHTVDENALIACFNENLSEELIREMAKRQPLRVVFRDSCFKDSPDKINVEEIFKLHAPNTSVRVI